MNESILLFNLNIIVQKYLEEMNSYRIVFH